MDKLANLVDMDGQSPPVEEQQIVAADMDETDQHTPGARTNNAKQEEEKEANCDKNKTLTMAMPSENPTKAISPEISGKKHFVPSDL